MPRLTVQALSTPEERVLPIFAEIEAVMDQIRSRAYDFFCERGNGEGDALNDWLAAEREICWPVAQLEEDDDEFTVRVALAGFKPEDISVTANPRELIIKASQESEEPEERTEVRWSEFHTNTAYRRIELPSAIDVKRTKASLKQGLLEIEAPKITDQAEQGHAEEAVTLE